MIKLIVALCFGLVTGVMLLVVLLPDDTWPFVFLTLQFGATAQELRVYRITEAGLEFVQSLDGAL